MAVLADHQWSVLEPLLNEARPWAARPIRQFRRTIEAIVWRQQNGAKWRAIPAELGPWWMAAQTFIRWAKLGVWERLHRLVQEHRGLELGMVFLDGTVIRAHQKAAGARKQDRTPAASAEAQALGRSRGGSAPRGTSWPMLVDGRSRSCSPRARRRSCPRPRGCWASCRARRCGRSPIVATPAMRCARRSGSSAPPRRSRPGRTRPRLRVVPGSMSIASGSSDYGRV